MGKLQIEDRRQQEEIVEDPKKEESPLALPPSQQVQVESSQDLPKDWKFVINHPQDQIIEFSKCMHSEFEMSMMGELNFFLGLQIKQLKEGTFINQAKYIRDLLKMFNMEEAKTMKTPMSSSIKLDKDEKGKSVNSTMYRGMIERITRQENAKKIGALTIERPRALFFFTVLLHSLKTLHITASRDHFRLDFGLIEGFWLDFILSHLDSTSFPCVFSIFSVLWMAPRRETGTSRAQGKHPTEPCQPEQTEARRKASINFSQLQHFGFEGLFRRMGWLPVVTISKSIFPTLVQAFYSRPREAIQRLCRLADAQGMGNHRHIRGPELDILPLPQSKGIHVEAIFSKPMMTEPSYTAGPSSQPSFTELPHTEIPS
ncbi:hypothetical protein AAG906_018996 [Vitis piasezkii]